LFYEALGRAVNRHHYRLFAFVVMPEHVHLLVQPKQDGSSVSSLLNAVKRPFSFRIKKLLTDLNSPLLAKLTIQQRPGITTFRFWQEGPGYDRNLTSPKAILSAIDYIHNNPVRRGLCQRAVDWKWSSACHYLEPGMEIPEDLVNIDPLPPDLLDDGAVI
jgi:putative transposase